ncbi:MAG: type 2 isopentenyl-diphosphate Delta-isomerase [Deltaproteobacteria bacterium]|nr:type 2 isopentenyl-diphosphate Delta-isomerase [Deltaproteobacteria bacterium]
MSTISRKSEHIRVCVEEDVEPRDANNGLDAFRFDHDALPDLDFDEVDTGASLLGRNLRWPFFIGSMTGGTQGARDLNTRLAVAAARSGCGMALGSLRPALEDPDSLPTFDVRKAAPDLPLLLGNIGIAQMADPRLPDRLPPVCERLRLDGLIVHLNPMQEVLQPEGDTRFKGLLDRLVDFRRLMKQSLDLPLVIKEVGSGFSESTSARLRAVDPDLIETAGTGGTSWIRVEGLRGGDPVRSRCSVTLAGWGHSLAQSISNVRKAMPGTGIVASGGLRTGLDLAVALRLGASAGAMALPLLKAALEGSDRLDEALDTVLFELRAVMFGTGSRTLADLKRAPMMDTNGEQVPLSESPPQTQD